MERVEDVVIVGAGLAGLATALGLHRKGIKSLVLESSETLRASGFGLTTWTNAWRALEALGVADSIRQHHTRLQRETNSTSYGAVTSEISVTSKGKCGVHELRCVQRNFLVETLAKELPQGAIRYSSKLVSIDEVGDLKILHLADASILKTKVLIGCDGVNSIVAKWLGLKKPSFSGRSACRGFTVFPNDHGFKAEFSQYFGEGFRCGVMPFDDNNIYWYFTWTPTAEEKEAKENAAKVKELVSRKMRESKMPEEVIQVIQMSKMGSVISSSLKLRSPFELIWGNITKGNTCVAGDAFHPMTPDLGQGGCSALEDGVVLARCLGEALVHGGDSQSIKNALGMYARERRWRGFALITMSYIMGCIQESRGILMRFLRDKLLSKAMATTYLQVSDFDCGSL